MSKFLLTIIVINTNKLVMTIIIMIEFTNETAFPLMFYLVVQYINVGSLSLINVIKNMSVSVCD